MPSIPKFEYLLNNLVESAPDAMIVIDHDGSVVLVNRQVEVLFGYDRGEILGRKIEVLIPGGLAKRHVELRNRYLQDPKVRPMGSGRDLKGKKRDGAEFPVDIMLSPVKDPNNLMVVATIRDATERHESEKRLAKSEAMFRALYDQAPDAIIGVNRAGEIIQLNQKVESMFGYSGEELRNQPIEMLIPRRYHGKHVGQRDDYMKNPITRPMGRGLDLFARRKDGNEFPVDILLSPVHLPGDDIVITVVRDITERRQAEREIKERAEQLVRSNQELEQFAYVASHDLQEPLRAVAASCQIMQKRLAGKYDEDTNEYIEFAIDGAKRMQELINDLLSYSRVSKGEKSFEDVDLKKVMERVTSNLQRQIEESGAAITVDPLPLLRADSSQMVQLFQNLLTNAMKFRGANKPQINVSCSRNIGHYVFKVKDNGIGVAPEYQERIFVIFQRLHRREEYPGTGIGLAICKKIVERHGGKIWIESSVGNGTTFLFTIATGDLE